MSSKKIKTCVVIVDDQEIPVSISTAKKYYRYYNTVYFDRIVMGFLTVAVLGYLAAYLYYSFENNKLIAKPSQTCPTFYCPSNQNQKSPCGGKGFHIDQATKSIVCTN